ncbi:aldo/keto reductase [Actinomycetota bacterium]
MKYIKFPKLGIKTSRFGMGCMRLPKKIDNSGNEIIDEKESIRMIRHAVNNGINYFDTAFAYGDSEEILGKALSGGLRGKVLIATKSPIFSKKINNIEDFREILNEELKKLQTEYTDFYLLHNLNKETWRKTKKLGLLDELQKAKRENKIKYAGFSFHDDIDLFKEIIDSHKWDMCQIQLNFLGEEYQAGVEGLKYAASKGIGVVIMEPLLGGLLTESIPVEIIDTWKSSGFERTPAEWAFRWVADFPEAIVILSGVSTMEQLKENIEIFEHAIPGSLNEKEVQTYKKVKKIYDSKLKVGCTGCSYCLPCPSGVYIPGIFTQYNNAFIGGPEAVREGYKSFCTSKMDASQCSECGQCEDACPQHIPIIENLKEAHEHLVKD